MSGQAQIPPPRRHIHGRAFLEWPDAAGIIPSKTTRVVIEASINDAVRIYVEQYGDEGLISVEPPPELRGAEIKIIGRERSETDEALGTWGR